MLNWIKSKFRKNKKVSATQQRLNTDELFRITFSVNVEGGLYIDGAWVNSSQEIAFVFGQFLSLLNSGQFEDHIKNYFGAVANTDESYYEFAKMCYEVFMQSQINLQEQEDSPLIRPSQTFRLNNNNNNIDKDDIDEDGDD